MNTRKRSSTIWSAGGWISLQDIEQHYGKKRAEAAETLQVSVSTFKRICRQHGILRWPSAKRKRDKGFLPARKSNASFQSNHREGDRSNHNMLGNSETTKGASAEASRQCKARNVSLAIDNLTPNALAKTSQPLQNGMPGDEESEISSMSSQKRKRLEKETDYMEKVTHSEEQLSQMQNFVPKRQAVESASKDSSFLTPVSGTIEGNNMDYNPNSITYLVADDMDTTRMGVQPSLESISTEILNSFPCNENTAHNTKLHFDNLIALPLEDLIDPENESSMKKALSTLADNLSLFSEEQAEQILGLSFDFPTLVHSWREYSRSQMYSQKSFAEMEKIRDLVETSAKDEETLNVRYEELKSKEKELMAQLEAVQKEKAGIAEQRNEKSKQTKYLDSLAEEKAAGRTKGKHMMKIATTKLNNLIDQWAKIQSFFV
ncbi:uncharacterized protein LOC132611021 isoform X2 [Lycium barbarum]|uniref:uncharacterized protein LOC132611021 isoform X2 n=1 Tax=Lycium barbarum TaxID=112863 RepID=UPI00293EE89A|nr:uncharacterized protein LOC132611021 isoform X2 [Lycium barbarum]